MAKGQTVGKHEELNLHIKKRTVNIILRSIIGIPIGLYLLFCNFAHSSLDWSCQSIGCFEWWNIGAIFIMVIVALVIILGLVFFIFWKID